MTRQIINEVKDQLRTWSEEIGLIEVTFFVSIAQKKQRTYTWRTTGTTFDKAWFKVERYLKKQSYSTNDIKIELQTEVEQISATEALRRFSKVERNNYFPYGVSFKLDGSCCFTVEEIVGNALLVPHQDHRIGKNKAQLQLNVRNLTNTIRKKYKRIVPNVWQYIDQEWTFFQTRGVLIEGEQWYELEHEFFGKGVRKITKENTNKWLHQVIARGSDYLLNQIRKDGSFIYGYYPTYHKYLPGYNSVRHFSSLYALLEAYEYQGQVSEPMLETIETSLTWGLQRLCFARGESLFVREPTKNGGELKLGAQAVAILALAKYESLTKSQQYRPQMLALLEGLTVFIDEQGNTLHVLHEDLSVKESFRIVYYDGEALFTIMRAYPLLKDARWLALGECLMQRFIRGDYARYHDHWLSYSVNELTQYAPKPEYFAFGLKNVLSHLTFMENRDTAYPTFLELLCAATKMFQRMEQAELTEQFEHEQDYQRVVEVMQKRVRHQLRTGVMWPEFAQYFARPDVITDGFYARHDRFRMRIDDAEHFLSGFINYAQLYPKL